MLELVLCVIAGAGLGLLPALMLLAASRGIDGAEVLTYTTALLAQPACYVVASLQTSTIAESPMLYAFLSFPLQGAWIGAVAWCLRVFARFSFTAAAFAALMICTVTSVPMATLLLPGDLHVRR